MVADQINNALSRITIAIIGSMIAGFIALLLPTPAQAHVSQQGFVLLLPTTLYIVSGVAVVAITTLVIALVPAAKVTNLFNGFNTGLSINFPFENVTSIASTVLLVGLVLIGFYGTHDPLENLLPLFIWTLWWQGFLTLQALFGNLWNWLNPWTGIYHLIFGELERPGWLQLPTKLGIAPAIIAFIGFSIFSLIDLAPDNPSRLALVVTAYWFYTLLGMVVFGARDWLSRAECFTILLGLFAKLSPFSLINRQLHIGLPGWRLADNHAGKLGIGIFVILILATGSFDGLNETFWWLAKIGVNPLEFPGRSQVVLPNLLGLALAQALLPAFFAILIFVGIKLAGAGLPLAEVFTTFAISLLPIAFGYHFSHFLTAFLVNIQYAIAALSDPLSSGADYLGLGEYYVTSGFLNYPTTVKAIWLLQAAFVVGGHMVGVMLSHHLAVKMYQRRLPTIVAQLPMAIFMIAYTLFGLWLLASPRGV